MNELYLLQEDHGEYLTREQVEKELKQFTKEEKASLNQLKEFDIVFCYQIMLWGPNKGKYKRRFAVVLNPQTEDVDDAIDIIPITTSYKNELGNLYEDCKKLIWFRKEAGLSTDYLLYFSLYSLYENITTTPKKPLLYVKRHFLAKKIGHLQDHDIQTILSSAFTWKENEGKL